MHLQRILPCLLALLAACPAPQAEPDDAEATAADTTGDDAHTGDATETDACEGPDGCYACAPMDPAGLLNACSDAACQPFANTAERLPRLTAEGELPPLP